MAELAGVLVGNYFLLECLAREGIVETYRARPTNKGGYDAILRLFRPEFPDPIAFREHFATEVEKVWRCHHEHIQPLLEFGTGDDLLYCATLVPGAETLEQYLERQAEHFLPVSLVLRFMAQLCAALQYAHEQGIVHGNIQPTSILVSDNEDVQITHFAMKRAYQDGEPLVAQIEEGNATYIAPEQALGMIRPASDIYALGVLLYHLLTGVLPYDDENPGEIALKHTNEPIPSLRTHRPELPEALELVVRVALAKSPEARFSSTAALAQALHAALIPGHEQVVSAEPERRILVRAQHTRFTWSRAASFLTMLMLLFGLVGASFFVFSLPQHMYDMRGRPFWNLGQSKIVGQTPGSTPAMLHLTPTRLAETPTPGANTHAHATPTASLSQAPIAGRTPTPSSTPTPVPIHCGSGTLSIDGSQNLAPLLQHINSDYQAVCPGVTISLGASGSRIGLNNLRQNAVDAASTDLSARPTRNLTDQPIVAMLYTLIVNSDVQVSGLSSDQIQGIYQGQITNWSQVGGPNEAITVIQRPTNDTVALIFRAFVLNGQAEHVQGHKLKKNWVQSVAQIPGSISYVPLETLQGANVSVLAINNVLPGRQAMMQGNYPFWSVEHIYIQGNGTSQFQAYRPFINSSREANVFAQYGAVAVSAMPQNVLASHLPGPEI